MAEDRAKFSSLLDDLGIDQPQWSHVTDVAEADRIGRGSAAIPYWCARAMF